MINSMTGFGSREIKLKDFVKISLELRSTNHKFLEIVIHLPEGFLSLEDRIKKEIERRLKRGRVVCLMNISAIHANNVVIHQELVKKYLATLNNLQKQFNLKDNVSLDILIRLPGVLSLEGGGIEKRKIWPPLKHLLEQALEDLLRMRQKEGFSLQVFLKSCAEGLNKELVSIRKRFKQATRAKVATLKTDEERASFLKDADITEETERLKFHIKNFTHKLSKKGAVGKELDFIAQEMQRETNTIGAKSCDTLISAKVVQMKSQIEKIREQAQNIE